jgi:hypothetical protein
MATILIYKDPNKSEYSSITYPNEKAYELIKKNLGKRNCEFLWEKMNLSFQQIIDSKRARDKLIEKLNEGKEVNLEKELSRLFR